MHRAFPEDKPIFRFITLKEPPKHEMIPFLDQEHNRQTPDARPTRTARVQVVVRDNQSVSNSLVELLVDIDHASVVRKEHLVGKHSYIDPEYMKAVEKACISDPRVQDEIKKLKLPAEASVVVEAWAYATDGMNDMSERTTMVRANIFFLAIEVAL